MKTILRNLTLPLLLLAALSAVSCNLGGVRSAAPEKPRPRQTVTEMWGHLEGGRIDEALGLMSARSVRENGAGTLREDFGSYPAQLKQLGGVKAIEVTSEKSGDQSAEVTVLVRFNSTPNVEHIKYTLVRENGGWKIDDANEAEPAGTTGGGAQNGQGADEAMTAAR